MRHARLPRIALVAGVIASLAIAAPVGAITHGTPDGGAHPYVGQLFFFDPSDADPAFTEPGGWFNCTGTLISPRIVLTAGHCTFPTGLDGARTAHGYGGNDTWVSFLEAPDYGGINPTASYGPTQNHQRYLDRVAWLASKPTWHRGTAYPHPAYDDAAFYLADAGVVILDEPVRLPRYAQLAGLRYLDQFAGRAKAHTVFQAVGYGLEVSRPTLQAGGDTRLRSEQVIVNANGVYGTHDDSSIVFSNNNGTPHRGGTCSGDSGGPFLRGDTDLQVAVNSYGVPPNCTGGDGAYRIDQPDDVVWLAQVLAGTDPRFAP